MPALLPRLATLFALLGCVVASVTALLTVASIGGRSLLSTPIPGDVELTQFGIALAIALSLPWCQLRGGNIIVDFFTQRLASRRRQFLDGIGTLLLALMTGLLAWRTAAGAVSVYGASETTMILGLPMGHTYAVLAPGLALTAVIACVQTLQHWRGAVAYAPGEGLQ
jgi:TRAP-type C4-dicarboxylate transport system permease small subunit